MIAIPPNTKIWIAFGHTDMRKGFDGLAALVQTKLKRDPFYGHIFVFRGRRGHYPKILWWDNHGLCLFAKRLEQGLFRWPRVGDDAAPMTAEQLSMLLEGLEWRHAREVKLPTLAG